MHTLLAVVVFVVWPLLFLSLIGRENRRRREHYKRDHPNPHW